jgi:hypothetical protein
MQTNSFRRNPSLGTAHLIAAIGGTWGGLWITS